MSTVAVLGQERHASPALCALRGRSSLHAIHTDHPLPCATLATSVTTAIDRSSIDAVAGDATEQERLPLPRRIHIIGGPGCGKTTLSRQMATLLNVPAFELDEVGGAGPAPDFRLQRSLAQRQAEVARIATLPGWVTEGTFLGWTDQLLDAASVVVWLDLPLSVALRRIVMRHLREYLGGAVRQGKLGGVIRTLRYPHVCHLYSFVLYTWHYYRGVVGASAPSIQDWDDGWALTRAHTVRHLQRYTAKVIHCTRPSHIGGVLHNFNQALDETFAEGRA